MAYVRDLSFLCSMTGCKKQAYKEVFDCFRQSHGLFCSVCAKRKLRDMEHAEATLKEYKGGSIKTLIRKRRAVPDDEGIIY